MIGAKNPVISMLYPGNVPHMAPGLVIAPFLTLEDSIL